MIKVCCENVFWLSKQVFQLNQFPSHCSSRPIIVHKRFLQADRQTNLLIAATFKTLKIETLKGGWISIDAVLILKSISAGNEVFSEVINHAL